MEITRSTPNTVVGPSEWFTGPAYMDTITDPHPPSRAAAVSVHFAPGARTAWHTHPVGQTLYVTEGVGRCQREGGPVETIRAGDVVWFEPDERHWHGASPEQFMTHIAIHQVDDDGSPVSWGEHVSDAEYLGQQDT
jgi:quercetin dioxygenase-like cupin family protein